MTEHRIFIALGGNIGEVLAGFRDALEQLATQEITLKNCSRAYQTKVHTVLQPAQLLMAIQSVENTLGRVRHKRWESRTIDLDIIMYGDLVQDSQTLTIPHREMHRRAFVLDPLADIAADLEVPGFGKTVAELAAELVRAPDDILEVRENWL